MALSKEKLEQLRALKPRAFQHYATLSFTAPTWCMRRSLTLDSFLPDLAHPTRGAIAFRDFANIPSNALKPFFQQPDILDTYANDSPPKVTFDDETKSFIRDDSFRALPGRLYAVACDLSVSGDATGFSLLHAEPDGKIVIDFSIRITATPRVDYRPIEEFIIFLRDNLGFVIVAVAFDQFQSHRTIETLKEAGFDAKVVRYADSFAGCSTVSDLIHSEMLVYSSVADKDFIGEAKELQSINDKRVDHLTSGGIYNSKDVWDSVVNATVTLLESTAVAGIRLTIEDFTTYDPSDLEDIARETNLVFQFAFLYYRADEEKDPSTLTTILVAKDVKTNIIYIINAFRREKSVKEAAATLINFVTAWSALPFKSTNPPAPIELCSETSPAIDVLADAMQELGSDLDISKSLSSLSIQGRIEVTKDLIRKGRLQIPKGWESSRELARLIRTVIAYPYTPDDYDIRALVGAAATADEYEHVAVTKIDREKDANIAVKTGPSGW